ncbi:MAG: cation:proton antiporter [Planctomycetes bacterium]|nr:cation:proton antiporter [Planctomycetota bacterium]
MPCSRPLFRFSPPFGGSIARRLSPPFGGLLCTTSSSESTSRAVEDAGPGRGPKRAGSAADSRRIRGEGEAAPWGNLPHVAERYGRWRLARSRPLRRECAPAFAAARSSRSRASAQGALLARGDGVSGILVLGVLIASGFVLGEIATRVKLPRVTGYILAGIALNPRILPVIPKEFADHTGLVTQIALAMITFSVGGTLRLSRMKALGRGIAWITVFEAQFALLFVMGGMVTAHFLGVGPAGREVIVLGILLGALASPTDPTASLAVIHEYGAEGPVSSTVMGVTAFDDAFGIVNYSLCIAAARIVGGRGGFDLEASVIQPLGSIAGGVAVGVALGLLLNAATAFLKREKDGELIVLLLGSLCLGTGIAMRLGVDELLATMVMGIVVVNFSPNQERIFLLLERYTESLIFVLFFSLSGMHLDVSVLGGVAPLILLFVILRALGKVTGTWLGAELGGAARTVKRYAPWCLIPQGGIVIGLALTIRANPDFAGVGDSLIGIVIGATVLHELIGPVLSKIAIGGAGEFRRPEA